MASSASLTRVKIVDPLRGLAALAVAWFHFTNGSPFVKTAWLRASGWYGCLGVPVFFVISGFVIPYSMCCGGYQSGRHFGRFLTKRLVRLEPPYLASIALVIGLWYLSSHTPGFAGTEPRFSPAQLLLHLGYLNTFFGYPWLNPVYWTLGIEFQYYLFVALVYRLLTARQAGLRAVVVAAMCGVALLVQTPMLVFHYLGLFTLGILAFQYHSRLLSAKAFVPAVAAVATITAFSQNLSIGLAGVATALVIAFVPMPRHSGMRVLVFLGSISYSVYLVHATIGGRIVSLGSRFTGGLPWELAVLATAVGVTLAAAIGFNRLVERPAQRLSSRIKYRDDGRLSEPSDPGYALDGMVPRTRVRGPPGIRQE
jgi:peptidoglycan/LPS O-acetylase OafA/YrhL